jgi:hypothetical protein
MATDGRPRGAATRLVALLLVVAMGSAANAIARGGQQPLSPSATSAKRQVLGSANGLVYVRKTKLLPSAAPYQASATAKCPQGSAVTGGGAYIGGADSGDAWINSSSPEPPVGTDKPKKGWLAYAYNRSPADHTLHAYAICDKAGAKGLGYVRKTVPLPATGLPDPDPGVTATAACPEGSAATGGGAYVGGPIAFHAWINSSSPEPAGSTAIPKKGWIAYASNRSGSPGTDHKLRVYAICNKGGSKGLVYVLRKVGVPAGIGSQAHAVAKCPDGSAVAGGGAYVTGDASDVWINSSSPEPVGSSAMPKKGWIVYVHNNGLPKQTLYVYAICKQ